MHIHWKKCFSLHRLLAICTYVLCSNVLTRRYLFKFKYWNLWHRSKFLQRGGKIENFVSPFLSNMVHMGKKVLITRSFHSPQHTSLPPGKGLTFSSFKPGQKVLISAPPEGRNCDRGKGQAHILYCFFPNLPRSPAPHFLPATIFPPSAQDRFFPPCIVRYLIL